MLSYYILGHRRKYIRPVLLINHIMVYIHVSFVYISYRYGVIPFSLRSYNIRSIILICDILYTIILLLMYETADLYYEIK